VIRLTLKAPLPHRIAADRLIPERLAALSTREVERLPLALGNRPAQVADLFRVEGTADGAVEIVGLCRRVDRIGAGMSGGTITVRGDAGAYLGLGMRGGGITVEGSVDFGAATALEGGMLRISGDAGDGLAGGLPGAVRGMNGGTVLVGGSAGAAVGQRLRRGLIVIGGAAGACCGSEMIAGTIVIGGTLGADAGIGAAVLLRSAESTESRRLSSIAACTTWSGCACCAAISSCWARRDWRSVSNRCGASPAMRRSWGAVNCCCRDESTGTLKISRRLCEALQWAYHLVSRYRERLRGRDLRDRLGWAAAVLQLRGRAARNSPMVGGFDATQRVPVGSRCPGDSCERGVGE
jgi:formylmethanofuran dehydrogenase subunit C